MHEIFQLHSKPDSLLQTTIDTSHSMGKDFSDYDSQFTNSNRAKHIGFLPTSKRSGRSRTGSWSSARNFFSSHRRKDSEATNSTSASTSRSSTANSTYEPHPYVHQAAYVHPSAVGRPLSLHEACAKAQEYTPRSDVAEWAHQTHIKQRRTYWWCQGCFPPEMCEPLEIPKAVERAVTGRRVRIVEPATAYD